MITGINYNNEIIKIDKFKNIHDFIKTYIDLWYFSMITFSTVGYGDMTVINIAGKVLVSIEVFIGVTMGASWASVIFRKMSR
ncbi:potassium channel family protein [Paraclostridium benzoelyticum]